MNLDDALHTFIAESRELLQNMEDSLLHIEQSPDDKELINAIFRAAHTIKGSSGLFGLDYIVSFTHVAESVLDRVRNNELPIDGKLVAVLLSSCDHIGRLIEHLATGGGEPSAEMQAASQAIITKLNDFLARGGAQAAPLAVAVAPHPGSAGERDGVTTDMWHISLRFGKEAMRNGMDPLPFIRYLSTLGEIKSTVTLLDNIPPAAEMDPESCYLGFEIGFKSDADKAVIENVFEFVRDDCTIRILPPHSKIDEYLRLIAELPEEDLRVGEMLLRCGTLTQSELDAALQLQISEGREAQRPIGEMLVDAHMVQPQVLEAVLNKQKQSGKEHKSPEANLIRVDADKLDKLINLVGELIIAGAGTRLIAKQERYVKIIRSTITLSKLVEEVRDSALNLRMVQIGGTFNRFQRVVRDVSQEMGKDIGLVIKGAETELDKTVVEKIGDPLTHLVRNSMDHGIEAAEVRIARGKPAKGTLTLNAYHDSGSIVIEVSDDGGGLNKQRILNKAIERGLVVAGAEMSDHEIYNLIFEAGFSTAEKVSNLSGRGVGMDVVKRNITALRGTVELYSTEGEGSTVRIRLPLTLAIIDGFLVAVGASTYVIPLDMVVECVERSAWTNSSDGQYLNLRGKVLPYLRLREYFEVEGEPARRENVVVVRYGDQRVGLVVDRLLGEFQTVIKPLGKVFSRISGISGSTILGSGEVALILDVPGLMRQVAMGNERSEQDEENTR